MRIPVTKLPSLVQPSLFEAFAPGDAAAFTTYSRGGDAVVDTLPADVADSIFVSDRQKEIIATNRFYHIFEGKSLEEIEAIHRKHSRKMFAESRKSALGAERLSQWYDAMSAGETVALEKEYRKLDIRFLTEQTGTLRLIAPGGEIQMVNYKYTPGTGGTGVPNIHIEFRSDGAAEISSTGYYSFFGNSALVEGIGTLEELVEAAARSRVSKSRIELVREAAEAGSTGTVIQGKTAAQ